MYWDKRHAGVYRADPRQELTIQRLQVCCSCECHLCLPFSWCLPDLRMSACMRTVRGGKGGADVAQEGTGAPAFNRMLPPNI